jgi:hypothetical protein
MAIEKATVIATGRPSGIADTASATARRNVCSKVIPSARTMNDEDKDKYHV